MAVSNFTDLQINAIRELNSRLGREPDQFTETQSAAIRELNRRAETKMPIGVSGEYDYGITGKIKDIGRKISGIEMPSWLVQPVPGLEGVFERLPEKEGKVTLGEAWHARMGTPIVALSELFPDEESQNRPYRVARALAEVGEGLTTGENALIMSTMGGVPGIISRLASLYFGYGMGKGAYEEVNAYLDAVEEGNQGDVYEHGTKAIALGLLGFSATKHGIKGRKKPSKGDVELPEELRSGIDKAIRKHAEEVTSEPPDVRKQKIAELRDLLTQIKEKKQEDVVSPVEKAERADAIELELAEGQRLRQSPRGGEMLKEQLVREEIEGIKPTKEVEAGIIESQLVEAERIRQSSRGSKLLREELAAQEPRVIQTPAEIEKSQLKGSITSGREPAGPITDRFGREYGVSPVVELVDALGRAIGESARAIVEIIKPEPGALGAGPVFSESAWKNAKPHLDLAWEHYKAAGKSMADFTADMKRTYGMDIIPYVNKFSQEATKAAVEKPPKPIEFEEAPIVEDAVSDLINKSYEASKGLADLHGTKLPDNMKRSLRDTYDKYIDQGKEITADRLAGKMLDEEYHRKFSDPTLFEGTEVRNREMADYNATKEIAVNEIVPMLEKIESAKRTQETNPVIKRRKLDNGMTAPDVRMDEATKVTQIKETTGGPLGGITETVIHSMEKMGKPALDLFYYPIKKAEKLAKDSHVAFRKEMHGVKRGLSWRSPKRIGTYAIYQQKGGPEILRAMKKAAKPLNAQEMKAYDWWQEKAPEIFEDLQIARELAGREPLGKVENYFTFFRDFSVLEDLGFDPVMMSREQLNIHMRSPSFKYEIQRLRSKRGVELDFFRVIDKYAHDSYNWIEKGPVLSKMNEYLGKIGEFSLKEHAPNSYIKLRSWLDYQMGMVPEEFVKMPRLASLALTKLNRNLTFSILGANMRSAIIQPLSLINTATEIGPKATLEGIFSLTPTKLHDAMRKSNVLSTREYDVTLSGAIRSLRRATKAKRAVSQASMYPLQLLDKMSAAATWMGAYGKAKKKMGFNETEAIRYADTTVTKTQGSALRSDLSPIQRTVLGKTLTMFQTFTIAQWNFLTKDVLGIKNPNVNKAKSLEKLMLLVTTSTLANMFYEDVLGVFSPMPTPVRAFGDALEDGESVPTASWEAFKELSTLLPIAGGSIEFKSSPFGATVQFIDDVFTKIRGEPTRRSTAELIATGAGIPGTAQYGKWLRKKKREERKRKSPVWR